VISDSTAAQTATTTEYSPLEDFAEKIPHNPLTQSLLNYLKITLLKNKRWK
jgi:hypothetical protein